MLADYIKRWKRLWRNADYDGEMLGEGEKVLAGVSMVTWVKIPSPRADGCGAVPLWKLVSHRAGCTQQCTRRVPDQTRWTVRADIWRWPLPSTLALWHSHACIHTHRCVCMHTHTSKQLKYRTSPKTFRILWTEFILIRKVGLIIHEVGSVSVYSSKVLPFCSLWPHSVCLLIFRAPWERLGQVVFLFTKKENEAQGSLVFCPGPKARLCSLSCA